MPELRVGDRRWSVAASSNLLDALNAAGCAVPFSCRAGICHACLVRCRAGVPVDSQPQALTAEQHEQGWYLACQCQVLDDLTVELFDPARDGLPTKVVGHEWLSAEVLRLRLLPERPVRYRVGQHVLLWNAERVARPYSLASVPAEEPFLEFHIDCRRSGAFVDSVRELPIGAPLRLGEIRGGALQYDADWQTRPLLLLAAGTGLAPLWGILREALRLNHVGPIRLAHVSTSHYLDEPLQEMAQHHANLQIDSLAHEELPAYLAALTLTSRHTVALLCGHTDNVERFARRLYLAGLPRGQIFADTFVDRQR